MSQGTHSARVSPWSSWPDRSLAGPASVRGQLWAAVIAIDFFLLSNPLVYIDSYFTALARAIILTSCALLVTLPWAPIPRPAVPVLALLAWGLVSAGWSIAPSTTITFWVQAAAVAALGVAVASQIDRLVMIEGLVLAGVLMSAVSWYAHLTDTAGASFLTLDGEVGIAGVGTNRNILAYTLIIAIGAVVAHVPKSWLGRVLWLASAALIVFTLYSSESTTGYSAALAAVAASVSVSIYLPFAGWLHRSRTRLVSVVVGLLAAVVGLLYLVAKVTGEDILSFSGRTPVWRAAWTVAEDHLVRGHGWGAIWAHPWAPGGPNPVADRIYAESGLFLSHGHNSLVDVVVELGLVGVALVVLVHLWILVKGLREAARAAQDRAVAPGARLLLATLAAIAVTGISEPMSVIPLGWWALVLLVQLRTPPVDDLRIDPDLL